MTNHRLPYIAVNLSFVFWFGLYFGLYFAGWPGDPHPCSKPPYCFCETVHPGTLAAQVSNTWSDLGFVLVAFIIAWHGANTLKGQNSSGKVLNPSYKNSPGLISLYSAVILYMGPGSMFFHGSMTQWGGYMDVISMYLFVFFIICYLIYRNWDLSSRFFYLSYLLLNSAFIVLVVFWHDLSSQVFVFVAATLISLALLQVVPRDKLALGRKKDLSFGNRWLAGAFGFFLVAVTIWALSDTGRPLCNPNSLWQGHAAWHLLSACMALCIHFYFLSEKEDTVSDTST